MIDLIQNGAYENKKAIIIKNETIVAFNELICPVFCLILIIRGNDPKISTTANSVKVIVKISFEFIINDFDFLF